MIIAALHQHNMPYVRFETFNRLRSVLLVTARLMANAKQNALWPWLTRWIELVVSKEALGTLAAIEFTSTINHSNPANRAQLGHICAVSDRTLHDENVLHWRENYRIDLRSY